MISQIKLQQSETKHSMTNDTGGAQSDINPGNQVKIHVDTMSVFTHSESINGRMTDTGVHRWDVRWDEVK